jgi:uncharacterized protein (TIGR00251 family)
MNAIRPHPYGCILAVRAVPNAAQSGLVGVAEDSLRIRIKAPPVEGKANRALVEFLAETLSVRRRDVELVRGDTGRHKQILVRGLKPETVRQRLGISGIRGAADPS